LFLSLSVYHVPLQLLLELLSLSLSAMLIYSLFLENEREDEQENGDTKSMLIEFSLYACSGSGRLPRGEAPHAGDLPFVANATPTATAAAQCKDPLPMIIHSIYSARR
jgi:hypothetical protein